VLDFSDFESKVGLLPTFVKNMIKPHYDFSLDSPSMQLVVRTQKVNGRCMFIYPNSSNFFFEKNSKNIFARVYAN